MSWQAPNLAASRFENLRPVQRISALLGALAIALTAWNVGTWWRTGAGAAEKRAELARLLSETSESRARVTTLERDLAAADLEAKNREARFLNARIVERSFSWNGLLDDLNEALPRGVRVRQLSPLRERRRDEATGAAGGTGETTPARRALQRVEPGAVALKIAAEAEDSEAALAFVDALFAHPRFDDPDLSRESGSLTGLVEFDLSVVYRPAAGEGPP